jgi:DNA-binding response OmpR family regulator
MTDHSEPRLNLSKANVLILENNPSELDILGQVFIGFGVKAIRKCATIEDAVEAAARDTFDLMIADADMPDGVAFDFISGLRRQEEGDNRLAPMLLICGHTPASAIRRARDSGANLVIAKPITPKVMFDRVMWLAREERKFVVADGYVGPDRRHKSFGPPAGMKGRRDGDLSADIGRVSGPDLSQSDIDAMFQPQKASA